MSSADLEAPGAGSLTLSVIIPAYNASGWIGECVRRVRAAVDAAGIELAELIVVDDGSTDGTVEECRSLELTGEQRPVVVSQSNQGRLAARTVGLARATGDMVLFIDTRVHLGEQSLLHAFTKLGNPSTRVWTAHTIANTDLSPIAGFWQAIEHVAWRRYWREPRQVTFGIDDFDFYPKGTTALLAPRQVLVDAFEQYEPTVADLKISNDDTAVLRWVAQRHGITISPRYNCVYNSRTTLSAFVQHANHRGAVLIDGYLRPGARFRLPIVMVLIASPVAAWFGVRHPKVAVPAATLASVAAGAGGRLAGARAYDSAVLGILAIPFGTFYLFGMWRGVLARVESLLRGGKSETP